MTVTAEGDLTLHGQTRPVSVELTARWNGSTISVQGSVPITLADFGIEQISLPIVTVDEAGTLEFLLLFEREA
jgi:polyisoprenoid-binding protein YceI